MLTQYSKFTKESRNFSFIKMLLLLMFCVHHPGSKQKAKQFKQKTPLHSFCQKKLKNSFKGITFLLITKNRKVLRLFWTVSQRGSHNDRDLFQHNYISGILYPEGDGVVVNWQDLEDEEIKLYPSYPSNPLYPS